MAALVAGGNEILEALLKGVAGRCLAERGSERPVMRRARAPGTGRTAKGAIAYPPGTRLLGSRSRLLTPGPALFIHFSRRPAEDVRANPGDACPPAAPP